MVPRRPLSPKKTEQLLDEYSQKFEVYRLFTKFCRDKIEEFLSEKKCDTWKDSIKMRTKEPPSVRKKLLKHNFSKISEIRDLSGVRVTFFLEQEIDKFLMELSQDNALTPLKIVRYDTVLRDPGFMGVFLTLQLKEPIDNPDLLEYKGFLCELQIADSFQNTWAEVYHRTIYKKEDELSNFSKEKIQSLKRGYSRVIEGCLREVSNSVHYLYQSGIKLAEGAVVLSQENLEEIKNTTELGQTYVLLKTIEEHLHFFGPRITSPEDLLKNLFLLINRSKQMSSIYKNGISRNQVLKVILDICVDLYPILDKDVCDFLYAFWNEEPDLRVEIKKTFTRLAEYNVHTINIAGYSYHMQLLTSLEEALIQNSALLDLSTDIISSLLKLELRGSEWATEDRLVITQGIPPYTPNLLLIRKRCFEILFVLLKKSTDETYAIQLIRRIMSGIRIPSLLNKLPLEYQNMLIEESKFVVTKFTPLMRSFKISLKYTLEQELKNLSYWYSHEGLDAEHFQNFLDHEFQDAHYLQVRCLIGRDWTTNSNEEKCRESHFLKVKELAHSITSRNWISWKKRILNTTELYPKLGLEEFSLFEEFLKELATIKPKLANELLADEFGRIGWFTQILITSLLDSNTPTDINSILIENIKKDSCLAEIAHSFFRAKQPPQAILKPLFERAKNASDLHVLNSLAYNLIRFPKKWNKNTLKLIFTESISILSNKNNFQWLDSLYSVDLPIMKLLNLEDLIVILEMLVKIPHVYHPSDLILSLIAENAPEKVLCFFLERRKHQQEIKHSNISYSIWPAELPKLSNVLHKTPYNKLLAFFKLLEKCKKTDRYFIFNLLPRFFSPSSLPIKEFLSVLISKDDKNIELYLQVLEAFEGAFSTHNAYQALIGYHDLTKQQKDRICSYLLFVKQRHGNHGQLDQIEIIVQSVMDWNSSDASVLLRLNKFKEHFKKVAQVIIHKEKTDISREAYFRSANFADNSDYT